MLKLYNLVIKISPCTSPLMYSLFSDCLTLSHFHTYIQWCSLCQITSFLQQLLLLIGFHTSFKVYLKLLLPPWSVLWFPKLKKISPCAVIPQQWFWISLMVLITFCYVSNYSRICCPSLDYNFTETRVHVYSLLLTTLRFCIALYRMLLLCT